MMVRKKQVLMEMSAAAAFSACGRSSHMRPYKLLTGSVRVRASSKLTSSWSHKYSSLIATRNESFPFHKDNDGMGEGGKEDSQEVQARQ